MLKTENQLSRYALGLVMLIIGISSLILPIIIRWGSRQEDFELTDERDNKSLIGAEP
jgi:hypothetical protein